jgi:hypothetical protein
MKRWSIPLILISLLTIASVRAENREDERALYEQEAVIAKKDKIRDALHATSNFYCIELVSADLVAPTARSEAQQKLNDPKKVTNVKGVQ